MKVLTNYPAYASGNADFITKRAAVDTEAGERVIVCQGVEVDRRPVGTACISSRTVEMMVTKLGWKLQTDEDRAELRDARLKLADALERLEAFDQLATALERVFSGPEMEPPTLELVE